MTFYNTWPLWLFLIILTITLSVSALNNWHFRKETLGFLITPAWMLTGCFAFLFFQENQILMQVVAIGSVVLYLFFINNIAIFFYKTDDYISYSLENISAYCNILSIFFIYVSAFSFYILSVSNLYFMGFVVILATFSLAWQGLWINKISKQFRYFIFFLTLIIVEMFWVLHFWPTSFFVNGIVLTTVYYVFINLAKLHYLDGLNKKVATRYLIISSVVVVMTLITAQWT